MHKVLRSLTRSVASLPVALLALWTATAPASARAQTAPLWGSLEPGTHAVGFDRVWTLDPTRIWPRSPAIDSLGGTVARPVRVDVWYPARCDDGQLPLSTYLNTEAPAPEFGDLVFLTRRWDEYSYRGLAGDSTAFDRLMATETAVCKDAEVAQGRFPLVLYSAGWFNRAPDNTILAEFLASHGFVVATVPQLNPGLWTYNFGSDARGVENQVRDLEVALSALVERPSVDRRRIAAMGYSTGGDVALLLAGRNPLIDAVVGLDASWTLGPDNDVIESPAFAPEYHRVPVLAVRRPTEAGSGADRVLDSLGLAPRLVVEVPGADHGSFSDDPAQRLLLSAGAAEDGTASHALIAQTVLDFLREVLEGASSGPELSERLQARGLTSTFLPASPAPTEEKTED